MADIFEEFFGDGFWGIGANAQNEPIPGSEAWAERVRENQRRAMMGNNVGVFSSREGPILDQRTCQKCGKEYVERPERPDQFRFRSMTLRP